MRGRALSPSPIALFLLGLAEREADGAVDVGGRLVLLSAGWVVDIQAGECDGDLVSFLRDSGRVVEPALDQCVARAKRDGEPIGRALLSARLISASALQEVERRLWLDRLVRGLTVLRTEGREPSPVQAHSSDVTHARKVALVPLLLDALERAAAAEDAGLVGGRAAHLVVWLNGPHAEAARAWSRLNLDGPSVRVSDVLSSAPAAAPKIAALVRAGLARVISPSAPPAPAPRTSQIPAPPRAAAARQLPDAVAKLQPGASVMSALQPDTDSGLRHFQATGILDDPLDEVERAVASLEQASASPSARCAAWKRFGKTWETRYGSLGEAVRAYREAAAADETDEEALSLASDRCASIGDNNLALAYARAAVNLHGAGAARGAALHRYALLCRRLGDLAEALGAVRAASEQVPDDPEPLALAIEIWCELGRPIDAASAAIAAAEIIAASDPERAVRFVALAQGLAPANPDYAEAYARALARVKLTEASIAIRADVARRTADPSSRRSLLIAAAEQAELSDRPALAASLLTRAFDREPHLFVLYEPLDADLAKAELHVERAVILEEMAASAPEDRRGAWLERAADARLDLPGDGAWESELRARALERDPSRTGALAGIREQALVRDDARLLADALERALLRGRWSSTSAQAPMLEELAQLAEEALDAPLRAAWAWQRLAAIDPDAAAPTRQLARLQSRLDQHEARRLELEAAVRASSESLETVRELADHLRDDPSRRRQAIQRYRQVLDVVPDAARAADALERLYRLEGDEFREAVRLKQRADIAAKRPDRVRILNRLSAIQVLRRDLREAATACRMVLDELPAHREASIRMRRTACRLRDRNLLREALASEAQIPLPPGARGRVLTALALELETAGSVDEAISCAEGALAADPRSADAALLVARHLAAAEDPRAALRAVQALFGESPPMLAAWAHTAADAGEYDLMTEALDAWAEIAPYDTEPWSIRLTALPAGGADEALAAAVRGAIHPKRIAPVLSEDLLGAIERLGERRPEEAARLAIDSADALGKRGAALRRLAERLADATGELGLRRDALERKIATADEPGAVAALASLAALHRGADDRAAEARTHLRVLGIDPHSADSLERLVELYGETGEIDRLLAVLSLKLEGSDDPAADLTAIASAHARLRGDTDQAAAFLRKVAELSTDTDVQPLLRASSGLAELARPRAAVALLREFGRKRAGARAAEIYCRAIHTAWKTAVDPQLALETAVEGLAHAPGAGQLLMAFERIALELNDVETAEETYAQLTAAAMGPAGRRALGYRRARWLERAGVADRALRAYVEALRLNPGAGAIYNAVERLSRAQGDVLTLANATVEVSENAAHPAVRLRMAKTAAGLFERELAAPERAFDILVAMWEVASDPDLERSLSRIAGALRAEDTSKGDAAFERLLVILRERTEDAWLAEAKARLLLRRGRLHAIGRLDLPTAQACVDEAIQLLEAEGEDADADLLADLHLELASWLVEAGQRPAALRQVEAALASQPSHPAATALATQLGAFTKPPPAPAEDVPGRAAAPPAPPEPEPPNSEPPTVSQPEPQQVGTAVEGAADAQHFDGRPSLLGWAAAEPPRAADVTPPPADPGYAERQSWISAAPPDADSPEQMHDLAVRLIETGTPKALTKAVSLLCEALALAPHRLDSARELVDVSDSIVAPRAVHLARGLISIVEPAQINPEPLPSALPSELADWLRGGDLSGHRQLWQMLWTHARPLFRTPIDRELIPNQRVTRIVTNPVSRAFSRALDALRVVDLPPFYYAQAGRAAIEILRSSPPTLWASGEFAHGDDAMSFELGRMVELMKPAHILVSTLEPSQQDLFAQAVGAAFGPADDGGSISREAAAIASELWGIIPARTQTDIRELLVATDSWSDTATARAASRRAGDRAGLFACGDLGVALRCLADEPLVDESTLVASLKIEGGRGAELARFAFSTLAER